MVQVGEASRPRSGSVAPERLGAADWFRTLAERAGDVFYSIRTDPDLCVEFISETILAHTGHPASEYLADPGLIAGSVDPRDAAAMVEAFSAPPGQDIEAEVRWVHRDGRTVWTQNWACRRVRSDGSIVLEGTQHDITALRMAEQELRTSGERFRLAMTNSAIGMCLVDAEGTFLTVNRALCDLLGRDAQTLTRTTWQVLTHPDDLGADLALVDDVLAGRRDSYRFVKRFLRPDGEVVWGDMSVSCVRAPDGRFGHFVTQIVDVTAQIQAERSLRDSEEHYRLLAENASDVVFRGSVDRRLQWVSPSVQAVLGWRPDEMAGHPVDEFLHRDDIDVARAAADRLREVTRTEYEARWRCRDGSYRWLAIVLREVTDHTGVVVGRVASGRDVQAEVEARQALSRSEERFRLAMASAPTGMAVIDLDRRFIEVNNALCRLLGRRELWLLTHRIPDALHPDDDAVDLQMRAEVLSGRVQSQTRTVRMLTADGSVAVVQHAIGLLRDESGTPLSYVSQFVDVTEAQRAQDRLRFLASHDPLTSLANRAELTERMNQILSHPPRTGTRVATLYIDLDGLKRINDTHGHAVGDEVIVQMAARIAAQVRSGDVVARIGGDEYVVVLPAIRTPEDARRIAEKVLSAAAQPITAQGVTLTTTLSIGVALAGHGDDPDDALARADRALYRAKQAGRDRAVMDEASQ